MEGFSERRPCPEPGRALVVPEVTELHDIAEGGCRGVLPSVEAVGDRNEFAVEDKAADIGRSIGARERNFIRGYKRSPS